jgi:uncharacterized protein YdaU (DUF1376 family)
MHYYQFHIGDYKSHTSHLTVIEDCAYRRLLDFYYLNEKAINQRDVARQINMREYEQDVLTVLNEFFISTADGFIHPRADEEINKYKEFKNAGKRGAAKRWASPPHSHPNGEANSPPNATPIATRNQEPITKNHNKATSVATPVGVSDSVWQDFKTLRKAKKAPITERALAGLRTEAEKAGWTLEQALSECCVRGWQAFKADWVAQKPSFQDVIHQTTPTPANHDAALRKIEEDAKKAVKPNSEVQAKIAELLRGRA